MNDETDDETFSLCDKILKFVSDAIPWVLIVGGICGAVACIVASFFLTHEPTVCDVVPCTDLLKCQPGLQCKFKVPDCYSTDWLYEETCTFVKIPCFKAHT